MDYSAGGLTHSSKKTEEAEAINQKVNELLSALEAAGGKPLEEESNSYLVSLLRNLMTLFCKEIVQRGHDVKHLKLYDQLSRHLLANQKKRLDNRRDRVHKRAFQDAVEANQPCHDTIAAAVRALQEKPPFAKYEYLTLWGWAREIWTKPITVGRPRKK